MDNPQMINYHQPVPTIIGFDIWLLENDQENGWFTIIYDDFQVRFL